MTSSKVIQSVVVLLFVRILQVLCDKKSESVCKLLESGSENADLNVLCVGLLSKSLLLMTKDFYVFDLPTDSLRGDANSSKLYMNTKPEKIQDKWPKLWKDERFQKIKDKVYNSFTVTDEASEYLLFITKQSITKVRGVTYDLHASVVHKGFRFNRDIDQVMISATKKMLFYGLRSKAGKMEMANFGFSNTTLLKSNHMKPVSAWHPLCGTADGGMFLGKNESDKCEHPVAWKKVLRGFIEGDQVVLFGAQYIYLFDLTGLTNPGTQVKVGKLRHDGFFVCHPDYLKWALIALGLLMLFLALFLVYWFCCCRKRKKKTKKPTSVKSNKAGKTFTGNLSKPNSKKSSKKFQSSKFQSSKFKPKWNSKSASKKSKSSTKGKSKFSSKHLSQHRGKKPRKMSPLGKLLRAVLNARKKSKKPSPGSQVNSQNYDASGRSPFSKAKVNQ